MTAADAPGKGLTGESAAALWNSEGFSVKSPSGPIGIVEEAVRIPGLKRPAALAVCLPSEGRRVILVPVTDILEVDTASRTILLRGSAESELGERR